MDLSKVDSKKRIVLPKGQPGDVYYIEEQSEDRILLVKLQKPEHPHLSKEDALAAMEANPICPTMSWEQLRSLTRE